jgi:hypothetical protein
MMNLKSLFSLLTVGSLLLAVVSLIRFVADLWIYYHDTSVALTSNALNCRGLGGLFGGVIMAAVWFLLYRMRKH